MPNNAFKVNISIQILSLVLLCISLLIANSIYFIVSISIFFIILLVLTNESVKCYIDLIKISKFWLLFIFIAYIIIFRNILNSFVFGYKLLLIILFIKYFSLNINFQSLSSGIKTLLKPLDKRINIDKITNNIVIFIYFINTYMYSKKIIFSNYIKEQRFLYTFSLKYNIFPRVFYTMSKINKIESSLKLKFYKSSFEKRNIESIVVLLMFLILFIIVFFKEVIL